MDPIGQPFLFLVPDLAGTLEGIEGLEVVPIGVKNATQEQVAQFHVNDEGALAEVDLIKRNDTGLGGCAEFRGPRAVEVAMALGTVLAFLPVDLLCGIALGTLHVDLRRQALRLLSQTYRRCHSPLALRHIGRTFSLLTRDPEVGIVAREEIGELPVDETPFDSSYPALRLPFLPVESVAETVARLPAGFAREELPSSGMRPGVEAWAITDSQSSDTKLFLIMDAQWSVGCAYFSGPERVSFARDLAFTIRYFPVELAKLVCTESSLAVDRARAAYALGLASAVPSVTPQDPDLEAQACLLLASQDPDESVRGIARLIAGIAATYAGRAS